MSEGVNPGGMQTNRPAVTLSLNVALTFGRKLKLANPFQEKEK